MTREFEYNPGDTILPKRRIKPVATAIPSMTEGITGPSSITPSKHTPAPYVAVPEFKPDVDQQEAQNNLGQARVQADLEKGETSKSEGPLATSPASHALEITTRLVHMETIFTANRVALGAADNSVGAVCGRNTLARRNLLRTGETILGDDSPDEDNVPAVCLLNSDAHRRFEENKRLTMLSEYTEPSSSNCGEDADGLIPGLPNLTALNMVEPGVWMGQKDLRKGLKSTFSERRGALEDEAREGGPLPMAGSFFSPDAYKAQPRFEDVSPIEASDLIIPDAVDRSRYPTAIVASPGPQTHPLSSTPTPAVARAGCSSPVHLSPIREVDSSRDSLPEQSDASPPAPLQIESWKPPSTAAPSAVLSSDAGCVSQWYSIMLTTLAWVFPLDFLAGALYSLATTRAFDETPPDLLPARSQMIHMENSSGNLTMAWMTGHAVVFNVSVIVNATLDASETQPKSWSFLFDWTADGEVLSAAVSTVCRTVSAMPLPSFKQEFLRSMGFLGLFAAVFWLVRSFLNVVSRCWHWREDGNLFWTRTLLQQFDG